MNETQPQGIPINTLTDEQLQSAIASMTIQSKQIEGTITALVSEVIRRAEVMRQASQYHPLKEPIVLPKLKNMKPSWVKPTEGKEAI